MLHVIEVEEVPEVGHAEVGILATEDGRLVLHDRHLADSVCAAERTATAELDERTRNILHRRVPDLVCAPWRFSRRDALQVVGTFARSASNGQRTFLGIVRVLAALPIAGPRLLVIAPSALVPLDDQLLGWLAPILRESAGETVVATPRRRARLLRSTTTR